MLTTLGARLMNGVAACACLVVVAACAQSPEVVASPTAAASPVSVALATLLAAASAEIPTVTPAPTSATTPALPTGSPGTAVPTPRAETATPPPTVVATATAGRPATSPSASATSRRVLGYYVPYDATSWESFRAHAASLDYVAPQWVTIDACGQISSQDDRTLVSHARQHGVRVLPSLLTSQRWLNHRLLTDEPTRDLAVQQIAQYVLSEGYDGIDLDLEDVAPEDRQAYTEFVRRVAGALHQAGLTLAVAVPAKTSDVTTGWAGAYDYAALGRTADLMLVMAYAYTTSSSAPGSTAPYQWVDKVAEFAASQVPREKLLLGVAAYGYDWNVSVGGRATSLTNEAARRVAGHYGAVIGIDPASRSATFRYEVVAGRPTPVAARPTPFQHDITYRRPAAACAYPTPTIAPRPTVTPGATPARPAPTLTPPAVQKHIVWLEDAASVSARLEIARARMIGGAGIWRLGQEDPAVWPALDAFRSR